MTARERRWLLYVFALIAITVLAYVRIQSDLADTP
jgi:hypothetical protein